MMMKECIKVHIDLQIIIDSLCSRAREFETNNELHNHLEGTRVLQTAVEIQIFREN